VVRSSSPASIRRRRAACALAGFAAAASFGGAALDAHAAVTVPRPGIILVTNLPASIRSGHTFTLRELLPFAVVPYGNVALEERLASGAWQTLALTRVTPRVFWLHWTVPSRLRGTTLSVRLVLRSNAGQFLAASPTYPVSLS
jgi:hypothetical protein